MNWPGILRFNEEASNGTCSWKIYKVSKKFHIPITMQTFKWSKEWNQNAYKYMKPHENVFIFIFYQGMTAGIPRRTILEMLTILPIRRILLGMLPKWGVRDHEYTKNQLSKKMGLEWCLPSQPQDDGIIPAKYLVILS